MVAVAASEGVGGDVPFVTTPPRIMYGSNPKRAVPLHDLFYHLEARTLLHRSQLTEKSVEYFCGQTGISVASQEVQQLRCRSPFSARCPVCAGVLRAQDGDVSSFLRCNNCRWSSLNPGPGAAALAGDPDGLVLKVRDLERASDCRGPFERLQYRLEELLRPPDASEICFIATDGAQHTLRLTPKMELEWWLRPEHGSQGKPRILSKVVWSEASAELKATSSGGPLAATVATPPPGEGRLNMLRRLHQFCSAARTSGGGRVSVEGLESCAAVRVQRRKPPAVAPSSPVMNTSSGTIMSSNSSITDKVIPTVWFGISRPDEVAAFEERLSLGKKQAQQPPPPACPTVPLAEAAAGLAAAAEAAAGESGRRALRQRQRVPHTTAEWCPERAPLLTRGHALYANVGVKGPGEVQRASIMAGKYTAEKELADYDFNRGAAALFPRASLAYAPPGTLRDQQVFNLDLVLTNSAKGECTVRELAVAQVYMCEADVPELPTDGVVISGVSAWDTPVDSSAGTAWCAAPDPPAAPEALAPVANRAAFRLRLTARLAHSGGMLPLRHAREGPGVTLRLLLRHTVGRETLDTAYFIFVLVPLQQGRPREPA
eukprot:TRINITY_DN16229_c0_g1_i1.p1 TRINITY_DN16229_c0_g1~~TRINITY_DN16229_c0_g1_i1.p1  ORF type:complete len:623 (+),score=158.82 TRINITY_DN16229_c0_g1_i1:67-1869(+)